MILLQEVNVMVNDFNEDLEDRSLDDSYNTVRKKIKKCKMPINETLPSPSVYKEQETNADVVAKIWALKLNRLPEDQRIFAEKIINDVLFEAEMGTLTQQRVRFISAAAATEPVNDYS